MNIRAKADRINKENARRIKGIMDRAEAGERQPMNGKAIEFLEKCIEGIKGEDKSQLCCTIGPCETEGRVTELLDAMIAEEKVFKQKKYIYSGAFRRVELLKTITVVKYDESHTKSGDIADFDEKDLFWDYRYIDEERSVDLYGRDKGHYIDIYMTRGMTDELRGAKRIFHEGVDPAEAILYSARTGKPYRKDEAYWLLLYDSELMEGWKSVHEREYEELFGM